MSRIRRWLPPVFILLLTLFFHATPCVAAQSSFIRVTGTSIGPGVASITIESFGLAIATGPQVASVQSFVTNVPIPALSSAANTATLIRSAVDATLPADYAVIISAGTPNFVQINRTTGTFTMSIVNGVHPQVIEEFPVSVPFLGTSASVLLGLLLLAGGVRWFAASRRRALARG